MNLECAHRGARAALVALLLLGTRVWVSAASSETFPDPYETNGATSLYGPSVEASTLPERATRRDPALWPRGYYPGDPLPPKTIYLTFDDGPWDFTGQIVDTLHEEGVRATFFMNAFDKDTPFHADIRKNILLRYADVLRRMVAYGDVIGNHTYSHRDLGTLSPAQIDFQLSMVQRQLKEALGDAMPVIHLIRPPFGSPWLGHWASAAERRKVTKAIAGRYLVMMWTIGWDSGDSVDWAPGEWYEATNARYHPGGAKYDAKMRRELARIFRRADGSASGIILMHDTHPTSRDILKSLIEELKRRGYTFATLEDYCRWRWGPHVFDALDVREASGFTASLVGPGAEAAGAATGVY
ncbi:MAG TPA: polysaccharide deacetylase family protein [Rectinemataceae bacterium]|nr:polysaccharide deacetylase family protein [Rectinemataceae bacterium]